MRIRHIYPNTASKNLIEGDRAFFLRNELGDFLSLYTQPETRYQGWFIYREKNKPEDPDPNLFYKVLETIQLVDEHNQPLPVQAISLTMDQAGWNDVYWEYQDGTQLSWQLLPQASGVQIITSKPSRLQIVLDMRKMYASPVDGRQYQVQTNPEGCLITYQDPTFDSPLFLHIRCKAPFKLQQNWIPQNYPRDVARHSEPTSLYIYSLATLETAHLSLGAGWTKEEAEQASLLAGRQHFHKINIGLNFTHDNLLNQINTAKYCLNQSLRLLQTDQGIYAGLPWFHQVWSRDELIAALGFPREQRREVIERYLGLALENGELPTYFGSHTTCADGVGWLALLIKEYPLSELNEITQKRVLHLLQTAIDQLKKNRQAAHGLIYAAYNATWMDTIGRQGFPLEIQTAYALSLQLVYELSGDQSYERERLQQLSKIRQHYFKNAYLMDGATDPTKRANVFLAYLMQPDLLTEQAWQKTFDLILKALELNWGGLASIDKNDARFQRYSTGQDNQSYHNGDSWFFINNLVAITLKRFNQHRYGEIIVNILKSSTEEILWHNFLGHAGEISSALELESWGCGIQAFSAGTYLALLNELDEENNQLDGQTTDSNSAFWVATADSSAFNLPR
jgi:hypothetical protein